MAQRKNNSILTLIVVLMAFLFVTGCNRGYGCPAELNIFEILTKLF